MTSPSTRPPPRARNRSAALAVAAALAACAVTSAAAADEACPPGDLLQQARVRTLNATGDARRVVDGHLADEGSPPGAGLAVTSTGTGVLVIADLGATRTINAFVLQADRNDFYSVEGSVDGTQWIGFWRASPVDAGPGLRLRSARLPRPGQARYLRVRGEGGDRRYALSEFRAYCRAPTPWPPATAVAPPGGPWIAPTTVLAVKGLVALTGLVFFVGSAVRRRRRAADPDPAWTRPLLLGLALAGGLCWWNLGAFNAGGYVHTWEHYHYYMGSKYFDELGYTRLYACSVVADAEDGLVAAVAERKVRNLATNAIEPTAGILADPLACTGHFSAERWDAFREDLAWFRGQVSPAYWGRTQMDHGYNATPLWTTLGGTLARFASPASDRTILALALIDPLLLLAMWACVYRTFGLRAAAAAAVWWGTNQAGDFSWTGGAFLRQDWLVLSVLGLCAMRSGRARWAGFALTWATLLRVFPGFLVAALIVGSLGRIVRARRFDLRPEERRFATGCAAALVLLGGLSLAGGGTPAWTDFAANTRVHLSSHGTNTLGLEPLLAYEHASRLENTGDPTADDPFRNWSAARDRVLARHRWIGQGALVLFAAMLAWAVRGQPAWVALVLGIGLIPFTSAQSCYYYSIFLGYGLLAERRDDAVAALLCGLALVSVWSAAALDAPGVMDVRFAVVSVALVAFVPCATWLVARTRAP